MTKLTPPLGWNSWNTFAEKINEQLIFDTVDKLVSTGLKDCGYEYVVIDDMWSLKSRDKNGKLVADPEKFPHGMKAVADYVHSKGLKFGMYSCAGNMTCAGYPGSFEHEFTDASTFAEWGVDFLKYDYCFHTNIIHGKYLYRRMGVALKNCGRDILLSACSWGKDNTNEWIRETACNMWRSTHDIFDTWESIQKITEEQEALLPYGGTGCFNDMDMLVVGMYGVGYAGLNNGCTDIQYKTHFSIWALMGSPLMIGCDVRNMNDKILEILTNKKLIEINQDISSRQIMKLDGKLGGIRNENMKVYAKNLENGDIAIGCFNFSDSNSRVSVSIDELGLPESTGKTLLMDNLWDDEQIKVENASIILKVAPYDCLVYRCKVVDK